MESNSKSEDTVVGYSNNNVKKAWLRSTLSALLDDPISEVDTLISLQLGSVMRISIGKMDGTSFDVAVLNSATVKDLKLPIKKKTNDMEQSKMGHRQISCVNVIFLRLGDLKVANLLMDENDVVKVADFGVARVQAQSGVTTTETGTYRWMAPEVTTAETGTYRWMAPEVIEHKPYDHKADVFSFGIVLWELLTGKGLRPTIPKHTHPKLSELLLRCWQQDPTLRPDFSNIIEILRQIAKEDQSTFC